jgi:hypothetical protein
MMEQDSEDEENCFSLFHWFHLWSVQSLTTESHCKHISQTLGCLHCISPQLIISLCRDTQCCTNSEEKITFCLKNTCFHRQRSVELLCTTDRIDSSDVIK